MLFSRLRTHALHCFLLTAASVAVIQASNLTNSYRLKTWATNGRVRCIVCSGNKVYIGGEFTTIYRGPESVTGSLSDSSLTRNNIASLDAITGAATDWNPNANNEVRSIAVRGATVYAGGYFTEIGGAPRNYLAALDNQTGKALPWDPHPDTTVFTVAVDGPVVYCGGRFTRISGQARSKIAALDGSTGNALPWDPNANDLVYTLAISRPIIYAGGYFTRIGGQNRNYIAAIDAATGNATAWDPRTFGDGQVLAIAISGATLFVGGNFYYIGGQTRGFLAELDKNKGIATPWNPRADNSVYTVAVSGNAVLAGGAFGYMGGQNRLHVAGLDATSGEVLPWQPDPIATNSITAIAASGTTVYIGRLADITAGCSMSCFAQYGEYVPVPELMSPPDAATKLPRNLALEWNRVPEASNYHVQLSTISDFSTSIVDDSTAKTTTAIVNSLENTTSYYWRVRAKTSDGASGWSDLRSFTTGLNVGTLARKYPVHALYAFSDRTIRFTLPNPGHVRVNLYDLNGRLLSTLVDGYRAAGFQRVHIRQQELPTGPYYIAFDMVGYQATKILFMTK
jgi:hypothetical protein